MTDDPRSALQDPAAADPVPDPLENALSGSYLSPSYWLTAPVMGALGIIGVEKNPVDTIADWVAGDWAAVQEAGRAVKSVGDFNARMSEALSSATSTVVESWEGDAADSAAGYFDELARAVESQRHAISSMGAELETVALGMYEFSQSVKGLLGTATDLMIQFLIELAAAGASTFAAATGVGAIITASAWAVALATGWKVFQTIQKIVDVLNKAFMGAQAVAGLVAGYMGAVGDSKLPALPGAAYGQGGV
ncbi:WXG100 family type VII secretion target [Prescottella equi]|uniref:WXG100 family type VII secretion target n=1 Tax=Rhodococcus hoagii TaxID=43767 RepID=UPI001F5BB3BF|nr:WXG100 family type VII secretion target [Prescottella equi]UNQ41311.1 WXG100 family type VII secretion target [Prescottella equi]